MPKGSPRPNAGRPKGAVNRRTDEAVKLAQAGGITPLDYLLSIMRDNGADLKDRVDCAKAAAPYVHARLANIDANVTGEVEIVGKVVWGGLSE